MRRVAHQATRARVGETIDSLPQPPSALVDAFPDFADYHAQLERVYRRLREVIQDIPGDAETRLRVVERTIENIQIVGAVEGDSTIPSYYSAETTYTAYCAAGLSGSNTVTIPASTYVSHVSQDDANNMALNAAITQAEAGLTCTLSYFNTSITSNGVNCIDISGDYAFIGGGFSEVKGNPTYQRIAKLDRAGNPQSSFPPSANNFVYAIKVLSTGKVMIGGSFTSVNGVSQAYIARLNSDGSLDTSLVNLPLTGAVYDIIEDSSGRIVAAGNFSYTLSGTKYGVVRYLADGTLDSSFLSPLSSGIRWSLVEYADGYIVSGASALVALAYDGSVISTMATFASNGYRVLRSSYNTDWLYICGGFTTIASVTRHYVARFLLSTLALDVSFIDCNASAAVRNIAEAADGKLYIHGDFLNVDGTAYAYLARLNTDATLDTSFADGNIAGTTAGVNGLAVYPDTGHVLFGSDASFTVDGTARSGLALFTGTGALVPDS